MNRLSRLFLVCGIFLLYISSVLGGNVYMAIVGAGFLGMWFEYNPK